MIFPFNLQTYLIHPERFNVYYRDLDAFTRNYVERLEWIENNQRILIKLRGSCHVMTEGEAMKKLIMWISAVHCTLDHLYNYGPKCGFKILYSNELLEVSKVLQIEDGNTYAQLLLSNDAKVLAHISSLYVIPDSNVNDVDECLTDENTFRRINFQVIDGQVEVTVPFGTKVNINYI